MPNNNEVTNIEFEYGTSTESYEFSIPGNPETASGENEISVSADLTDMEMLTTYYYRIKAQSGVLTFYGEEFQFTTGEVGINNLELSEMIIYPNPSNNWFTVKSELNINKVVITNMSGKLLFENIINSKNLQIDLTNYLTGIYFIEIYTDKGVYKNKLFKE